MAKEAHSVGYRPAWWPVRGENRNIVGVLYICQALHEDHTGSSDPLGDEERRLFLRCLEWVLEHWKQTTCAYDNGVGILVRRTLNERKPKPLEPPDIVCRTPRA